MKRSKPYYRKDTPKLEVLKSQVMNLADFTDNTDATGYLDFDAALPAGAIPIGWKARILTAFTGGASAILSVGIAGDLDRFSADTAKSIATASTIGASTIAADACDGIEANVATRVTITEAADFGLINAGSMIVELYYIKTV